MDTLKACEIHCIINNALRQANIRTRGELDACKRNTNHTNSDMDKHDSDIKAIKAEAFDRIVSIITKSL